MILTEVLQKRIYLIGMPGCGKSTQGKKLAKALGWQFIDLDKQLEANEGKSIAEIFTQLGENYFRVKEREALFSTFNQEQTVVACGGGLPAYSDNMDCIKQHGLSIYLKANEAFLLHRILASKEIRPLFQGLSEEKILQKIQVLLLQRASFYSQASAEVDIPSKPQDVIFYKALELIQGA